VLKRLKEYQSGLGDILEVFHYIKAELPVLLDALRQTKAALISVIKGCGIQIQLLDDAIRGRKALRSLWYNIKVKKITATLIYYHAAAYTLRPLVDRTLLLFAPSSTVPF
ncbi:hypothetical protein V2W45_1379834, partial [Cenococcum geophilum]